MLENKGKAELLGMPHGTANNRLRKSLLYQFAGLLGKLECYRCGKMITSIDDFSIEHKNSWAYVKNPVQEFFNLENIAFSHLFCNSSAGFRPMKKYNSLKEKKSAEFKRYYSRKSGQVLSHKRERYRLNTLL